MHPLHREVAYEALAVQGETALAGVNARLVEYVLALGLKLQDLTSAEAAPLIEAGGQTGRAMQYLSSWLCFGMYALFIRDASQTARITNGLRLEA